MKRGAGTREGDKEVTLLAGKQRPDPANTVHHGDLLFQTLHPALGPAPLSEALPGSSCPAGCCCDSQALPLTLVAPWKGICCVWHWLGYLGTERVFSSAFISG